MKTSLIVSREVSMRPHGTDPALVNTGIGAARGLGCENIHGRKSFIKKRPL